MEVEEAAATDTASACIAEAAQSTEEVESGVTITEEKEENKKACSEPTSTSSSTVTIITAPELMYANLTEKKMYWDRSHYDSPNTQLIALSKASTLYIGNLAFTTTSDHLLSLFSVVGSVRKINMGLDRYKKSPCGFAFVEYCHRSSALQAVLFLSGCKIDGRVVRVELDAGFKPGRQYGRGISGGQVRDDRRGQHDPARSTAAFRKNPPNTSGQKRGRDDEDEAMVDEPETKNPRFQDEEDDQDL